MRRKTPARPAKEVAGTPKGVALEEALRVYFSSLGYFALRAVPYRLDGADVTDVDLWLYERPATVARRRVIVDVKHKKSPQAAERLIWTKGLQAALGVEFAFVATTDRRITTQRLARMLKIELIEGLPFHKIASEFDLQDTLISHAEFDAEIRAADTTRHTTEWRDAVTTIKASLLTSLGFQSANRCLGVLEEIYNSIVVTPRASSRAITGIRILYLAAACSAISLDYAMAPYMFKSRNEREAALENGVRFGHAEAALALNRISAASSLVDKYLSDGRTLSKRLEMSFMADAENIPSGIIAEHVVRQGLVDSLFEPARELLDASLTTLPIPFDALSPKAKALMGVLIDFSGGQRDKFANLWGSHDFAEVSQDRRNGELPLE